MVVNATFLPITGGVFQRYYCEYDGLSSNDSCLLRLTAAFSYASPQETECYVR
jgi:hypothetical protein